MDIYYLHTPSKYTYSKCNWIMFQTFICMYVCIILMSEYFNNKDIIFLALKIVYRLWNSAYIYTRCSAILYDTKFSYLPSQNS